MQLIVTYSIAAQLFGFFKKLETKVESWTVRKMQGRSQNLQRWQLKFVDIIPILWTMKIIER